ncbi:MAG: tyrosine-type recombinase/integrase [Pirellulales bacterium]
MANIYKKPVVLTDPKTGKRVKTKSKKWWGRFRDENGREKRVPLAVDRAAALAMLNECVKKAERRIAGLSDPLEEHRQRPIGEHVVAFATYLRNKGSTPGHVARTHQQVRTVVESCKFKKIDDLSASDVQAFLSRLRREGLSVNSINHYQRAVKMFSRWLVRDRRNNDDRLAHLSAQNPAIDRRRVRRPLSPEEFARLLEAVEKGPSRQSLTGPDRVIVYILACYTGFRRNEIGSVTPQSFNFESDPPTLTVEAGYSKRRRTDVMPLRADLAKRIQDWIETKTRTNPATPLVQITSKRTAEMLKKDLALARAAWLKESLNAQERQRREQSSFLTYQNDQGQYADFHALRKTFITNLSRAGVSPKTAQLLARHSDINLTMNTYTMLGVLDQAAAVEALPPIPDSVVSTTTLAGEPTTRRDTRDRHLAIS